LREWKGKSPEFGGPGLNHNAMGEGGRIPKITHRIATEERFAAKKSQGRSSGVSERGGKGSFLVILTVGEALGEGTPRGLLLSTVR